MSCRSHSTTWGRTTSARSTILAPGVWAVIHFSGSGRPEGASDPHPREILDQRYARVEIDQEEYQRIRRELG